MAETPSTSTEAAAMARERLRVCLHQQAGPLLGAIRAYVQRSGLAQGDEVRSIALEVFQETAVEALAGSNRYDPARQPTAWLLGIALNVTRRRKVELARRRQRELPVGLLHTEQAERVSEQDLFDQLIPVQAQRPEQKVEAAEEAESLLALVSPADQEILRLALLEDHARETLAERFDTTSGALRVRLHRALGRLRMAWQARQLPARSGAEGSDR